MSISGQTAASITIGGSLAEVSYRLDLGVTKGSILSSAAVGFEVAPLSQAALPRIDGGALHAAGILNNGTVKAWGYNYDGELGNGPTTDSSTPVQATGLSGMIVVAGGAGPTRQR